MRPARCDRTRESISLRLDGMLSTFEAALLDRHLRRCPACLDFAVNAERQTQLLRGAELEQPARRVVVPTRSRPAAVRRGLAGALTAGAAAALAAAAILTPGTSSRSAAHNGVRTATTVLAVVSAQPSPSSSMTVPRIEVESASLADGPVHGLFSVPA